MSRAFKLAIAGIFGAALVICGGGIVLIQAVYHLVVGWAFNLQEVLPRVSVNLGGIALFALTLPLAAWLAHGTATWLWNDATTPWRWKWTWLGLATVMLMFVAGTAATGVVHQAGWLLRSPVPLTVQTNSRDLRNRVKCAMNLRQIGEAIAAYEKAGGTRPSTRLEVARVVMAGHPHPEVFVCPSSNAENVLATQPAALPAAIDDDRHFAYIVCPTPLPGPTGDKRLVIYEPLDNHTEGLNVLFDDGTTEFLVEDVAKQWLATTRPTSRPVSE